MLKLQPAKKKFPRMNSPHPHNWNIGGIHGNPFLWTYLDPWGIVIQIIYIASMRHVHIIPRKNHR